MMDSKTIIFRPHQQREEGDRFWMIILQNAEKNTTPKIETAKRKSLF
jgi:hypothetical protein